MIALIVALLVSAEPSYPWAASPTPNYAGVNLAPPCDATRNGSQIFDTVSNAVYVCNGGAQAWTASQFVSNASQTFYVGSDDGGTVTDVGNNCLSRDLQCATAQHACDVAPTFVAGDTVVNLGAQYSGPGCRKKVRQLCQPVSDGGVQCGTFTVTGTLALYSPSDGGTGSGTISAVSTGSTSTCAKSAWSVVGGGYNANELANKFVTITSGTGSNSDRLWPIQQNDAGVFTINAQGEETAPVAGSTYQIYSAPSTRITQGLGQSISEPAPESAGGPNVALSVTPAFVIEAEPSPLANAGSFRFVTLQHMQVTGSATILADVSGTVNIRENFSSATTTTSQLVRGLPGLGYPSIERNILTGTSRLFQSRFAATGANVGMLQMYDNLLPGPTNDKTVGFGSARSVWSQGNYGPSAGLRSGSCDSCNSLCDVWAALRASAENDPGASPYPGGGSWALDGANITGTGNAYSINLTGHFSVQLDRIGPASTVTASGGGNIATLVGGSRLQWQPTTTFNGAGFVGIQVGDSSSTGPTIAAIRAAGTRSYFDNFGNMAMEVGGNQTLMYPILSPFIAGITPPQICYGNVTFVGGTVSKLFASTNCTNFTTTPSCTCSDTSGGVAGTASSCSVTAVSTTGLTLDGVGTDTASFICIGGR